MRGCRGNLRLWVTSRTGQAVRSRGTSCSGVYLAPSLALGWSISGTLWPLRVHQLGSQLKAWDVYPPPGWLFFFFLKKQGLLWRIVSHSLDSVDCIPMVPPVNWMQRLDHIRIPEAQDAGCLTSRCWDGSVSQFGLCRPDSCFRSVCPSWRVLAYDGHCPDPSFH